MRSRRTREAPPAAPARDWRSYDAVADTYDRLRADFHALPARDLVELTAPPPGGRVLDVGTGPGVAALEARKAVGADGVVVGVDRSVPMLAKARARGIGLLAAAEAVDLPFRGGWFDAVIANFVIFFFTRYETALHDMIRVVRPQGRLGVTTWTGARDEFSRTWNEVAESFVGKELLRDAFRRGAPWEERFSKPDKLAETLRESGLRQVRVEQREYRATWSHADYLAGRATSVSGRFLHTMLGEPGWERFRAQVAEAFKERFADPIGDTSEVLLAVGTRPR